MSVDVVWGLFLTAIIDIVILASYLFEKVSKKFNFHAFWIIFHDECECEYVRTELVKEKIHAYIGYVPLHSSKVGNTMGYNSSDLPITEDYAKRLLRLPLHNKMNKEDSINISNSIKRLIVNFRNS